MSEQGLSVVLGTYNRKAFLKKTICSVRKEFEHWDVPHEIIVIDGGSNDGTFAWLTRQKDVVSIIQHNRGLWQGKPIERRSWGYFMNLGFKCAQGKYVCMISDDCVIVPGSLKNGYEEVEVRLIQGERLGALAFYWRNWPNSKKYFVITVKDQVYLNHGIYLRKALEDVDYINEDDYFFYCADTDLTFRLIKAGYTVEATTKALIEHCQHITVKVRRENKGENKERLRHDETALQQNWQEFFGEERYENVVVYAETDDVIPDDATAKRAFGWVYRSQRLKQAIYFQWQRLKKLFIPRLFV